MTRLQLPKRRSTWTPPSWLLTPWNLKRSRLSTSMLTPRNTKWLIVPKYTPIWRRGWAIKWTPLWSWTPPSNLYWLKKHLWRQSYRTSKIPCTTILSPWPYRAALKKPSVHRMATKLWCLLWLHHHRKDYRFCWRCQKARKESCAVEKGLICCRNKVEKSCF